MSNPCIERMYEGDGGGVEYAVYCGVCGIGFDTQEEAERCAKEDEEWEQD